MTAPILLYQFGNSVCCQKVRMVLAVKGLAWEPVEVNLFRNEQYAPAYLAINPAGVVPSLVNGSDVVIESTLICEYLDETFPDPPLMPTGAAARAEARAWAKLADEGLHEGVGEISFSAMFRERMRAMSEEERQIRYANVGDPRRRDRFMSTFRDGAGSAWVEYAVFAFERMFARLETRLGDGRAWIMGESVTLADIALMPYIARLAFLGLLDVWTADRPAVTGWWERTQQWSGFVRGIVEPMGPAEQEEMARHGPAIREQLALWLAQLRKARA